ncbi:MAG: LON peptidase substrate-binding domain-containing protein, partial [Alphaproteobacteria bacterium]|nr:LON peptidase substrate-binding domain-containing protein [Alphaproteobacteria bacterium]
MHKPYRTVDDLPSNISVFPLSGALLLPRGALPLNVFEPRYLEMVDNAICTHRLIGMIQPSEPEDQTLTPTLSQVGCLGRITSFKESEDNRYQITLTGI